MTVYIEYVLINNFLIDYLMLKATFATTSVKYSKGRLFLCAFFGALISCVFPLIEKHALISTVVKVLSGLLIVLISSKFKNAKSYYLHAVLFFGYTFFCGGALLGIFNLFGIDYSKEYLIGVMAIPVYAVLRPILSVIKYIYRRKNVISNLLDVEICAFKTSVKCKGFIDTGNSVYHENCPVIFCEKAFALKFISASIKDIKIKKISVGTVNGAKQKTAFNLSEIKIYNGEKVNIHTNVIMCVVDNVGEGYDVILHPNLLVEDNDETVKSNKKAS